MFRATIAVLKKTAAILTTIGFFAAAVFLAADLWSTADAAASSAAIDAEPSLLLALDKPQRPPPKLHLPDLITSLTDDELEMLANLPAPDLTAELNGWTFTQANLGRDISDFLSAAQQYAVALNGQVIYNAATLLEGQLTNIQSSLYSIHSPLAGLLTPYIDFLSYIQNAFSCYC